eukprot:CAMPEP_0171666940 /NCGR_PEP_ID=MMETSP0990-20121206/48408_1 /TAXON_ID=483369 /ORGANISM="non described non described, Strain CCMP2098" /LENGTH=76 /DNA_ID=CAMNT_0012250565 /DNA_START=101 /DNA_END=331 /DNA_ORIENTATION=+
MNTTEIHNCLFDTCRNESSFNLLNVAHGLISRQVLVVWRHLDISAVVVCVTVHNMPIFPPARDHEEAFPRRGLRKV